MRRPSRAPIAWLCALTLLAGGPAAVAESVASLPPKAEEDTEQAATPFSAEDQQRAVAAVEGLHQTLIGIMREADALGYDGRYERVVAQIPGVFDIHYMAVITVGSRRFRQLTNVEQERWVDAFKRLIAARYADQFDGFSGQKFVTDGVGPDGSGKGLMVRTTLVLPDEENVPLYYRMRKAGARWLIVDIYLNGTVSQVGTNKSEYASVLRRSGFAELTEAVEKQIAKHGGKGA